MGMILDVSGEGGPDFFATELQMSEKRLGVGLPRVMLRVFLKNTDMKGDRVKLPLSLSQLAVHCLPIPSCVCLL